MGELRGEERRGQGRTGERRGEEAERGREGRAGEGRRRREDSECGCSGVEASSQQHVEGAELGGQRHYTLAGGGRHGGSTDCDAMCAKKSTIRVVVPGDVCLFSVLLFVIS